MHKRLFVKLKAYSYGIQGKLASGLNLFSLRGNHMQAVVLNMIIVLSSLV